MAPSSVDASVTVGQKAGVEVEEKKIASMPDTMLVPPFSVNIYSFPLK